MRGLGIGVSRAAPVERYLSRWWEEGAGPNGRRVEPNAMDA
jgi:hypothetical protein